MPKRYTEIEIGPTEGGPSKNLHTGHKAMLADDARVYRGRVPVLFVSGPIWINTKRLQKPKEAASD